MCICRADVTTCAKLVHLIVIFVMALLGIALMGFGITVLVEINEFMELIPNNVKLVVIMSIVFGILPFVSAVVGFVGTFMESNWVLIANIIFMIGLVAVNIWQSIVTFANVDNLYIMMRIMLDGNPGHWTGELLPLMESRFFCCGSYGAENYLNYDLPVPPTCCPNPVDGECQPNMSYLGCSRVVSDYFYNYAMILANVAIRLAVVEAVAAVSGVFLLVFIKQKLKHSSV